ncbi:MAG: phosphoglycerate kinase, partial [Chitinophagaceae bacterium]|nr:phosphoglycerate kinase [Chitinophagaceae bacterium]
MQQIEKYNFNGKKVLLRVDFNVPLDANFKITDDTRMQAAVPTIQTILKGGGSVILMSHFGRPKNGPEDKFSLKHLLFHLIKLLNGATVKFAKDCIGEEAIKDAENLKPGEVLLLENVRFYHEEEKGDVEFAKKLASMGNVYVNDAFGTAHRAHASTAIIAQFFDNEHKLFGKLMNAEILSAEKVLHNTEHPFTAIIGGAKVSDKILIIEQLLEKANNIIIGGGMAYTFLHAQGKQIGTSICEYDKTDLALEILEKAKTKGVNILLPIDSIVADKFDAEANTQEVNNNNIPNDWMGLDIGEESRKLFTETILNSKTILWNGPMGVFEMEKFSEGTKAIALA